jgi:hypothetical protein
MEPRVWVKEKADLAIPLAGRGADLQNVDLRIEVSNGAMDNALVAPSATIIAC